MDAGSRIYYLNDVLGELDYFCFGSAAVFFYAAAEVQFAD